MQASAEPCDEKQMANELGAVHHTEIPAQSWSLSRRRSRSLHGFTIEEVIAAVIVTQRFRRHTLLSEPFVSWEGKMTPDGSHAMAQLTH